MGGEPTLENLQVICVACDAPKTYGQDIPQIAKAKRRQARHLGIKKPRTITRWRRFGGAIVYATRER
jgi:5-methylcytosine-specific restriction protein A